MTLADLEIELKKYKGVGEKTAFKFSKYKIFTIRDLLYFFPYKYLDLSNPIKIKEAKINENIVTVANVKSIKLLKTPKKKIFIIIAILEDETGSLKSIWYNQPFLLKLIKKNQKILCYGKFIKNNYGVHLSNPEFKIISQKYKFKPEIIPIYYEISEISTNFTRKLIRNIIEDFNIRYIEDPIPEIIRIKANISSLGESLIKIHIPQKMEDIEISKKRLFFEEIFYLQAKIIQEKIMLSKEKGVSIENNPLLINDFLNNIKINLTSEQQKVLNEILYDLQAIYPMNRLLQGETGSGKTLIAEIISFLTVNSGYKVLFMAPTEILATQHFYRFLNDFRFYDIGLGLIVKKTGYYGLKGYKAKKNKDEIIRLISQDKIKILIGTHSLLEVDYLYKNIGLIIIDEQQRFGIEQRRKLIKKSNQDFIPHFLSMTATPIPRTLYLAFYSDLSLSTLKEKPFNQKEIITKIIKHSEINSIWKFIRKQIDSNFQVFIICPRVEFDEKLEIKNVKEEYKKIKEIFPDVEISMLHGKMKSTEKENILKKLQNNEIKILVASSVVEVGIDLPFLTTIIILGAERFGLAQLHQLRGRVGRSIYQGFCFLIPENYTPLSYKRLKILEESQDAFYIAEKDLEIRGPGELLGNKQSGFPDLAMKSLEKMELVNLAKELAEDLLSQNYFLKGYPLLRNEIYKRSEIFFS
ncbi:MAG: ATP-dependent DNA helicase RecG [Candidatus Parcubacteria bacterium]|nr:MAG: ATP-dependent DNA helicase RecG [Candidatus Parcubacteria bacterium]